MKTDSVQQLRYLVLAIQREGNRLLSERLRPLAVTPSQVEVLHIVQRYGPLSLKSIGALLVCESGSPSRLLSSMVQKGLLESNPSHKDRRTIIYGLTQHGAAIEGKAARIVRDFEHEMTLGISEKDAREVTHILAHIIIDRPIHETLKRRNLIE